MRKIVNSVVKYYTNQRGLKTNRKIVVFESDDWGSTRMPNLGAFNRLSKGNAKIANDIYCRLDSIATTDDLESLFAVLVKFKDKHGNHPVITANTIVANPDYEKIKQAHFEAYYYETFDTTIKRNKNGTTVLALWGEGIRSKIFKPQLHGREHLHALLWLNELRNQNSELLAAFDEGCFGIPFTSVTAINRKNVMGALDRVGINGEIAFQKKFLEEGVAIFEKFFGYRSKSFIAPKYIWHPDIEADLKSLGINLIQGLPIQNIPDQEKQKLTRKLHYLGQRNKLNQVYNTRNSFFEPAIYPNIDYVDVAMYKIETAFKYKKPAIIGTHRINFIGALKEENRIKNLNSFEQLLKNILKKWPDVEFMSSDELDELFL